MIVNPVETDPRNIYKLLIGAVVPRPIAFVSTVNVQGQPNLAPFSFFTVASANPPVVCFCPMVRSSDLGSKDTLRNIQEVGEFVVNIVSESFAEKMNQCSKEYPPEVNEFVASGLTAIASDLIKPPRVAESQIQMECKLHQIIPVSGNLLGGTMVLGEVLRFHIDDALVDDFRIDPDQLRAIGRMGGASYSRTRDRFDLQRP